ncbi:hypothetical protein EON82_05215 [bacterium]|nr:MAG: hypothetical protein EON82_05215 [bacterium]
MARGSIGKKLLLALGALVALSVIGLFTTSFGKGLRDLWGSGAIQAAVEKPERRTYDAKSSDENLKALSTAIRLYHESEGAYPDATKWMDQIAPRLILNDLPKKEADKKLVRPDLSDQADAFGYSMNDAASKKYRDDLPKGTILLFESESTARNAHGDPKKVGKPGGRALTIEGELVSL